MQSLRSCGRNVLQRLASSLRASRSSCMQVCTVACAPSPFMAAALHPGSILRFGNAWAFATPGAQQMSSSSAKILIMEASLVNDHKRIADQCPGEDVAEPSNVGFAGNGKLGRFLPSFSGFQPSILRGAREKL